ncbi:hypothetical protein GCM10017673_42370 [Streptosporangium violaceochromogenes]|nr:hypothetical protein GCM10017673_42370 [Streptosporangium violaceochromogenes]
MTGDPRWRDLARHIADSLRIGAGTTVSVLVTDVAAAPAVSALVAEAYARQALPQVLLGTEEFDRAAVAAASDELLRTPAPLLDLALHWAEAHVEFRALVPPPSPQPDPRRLALLREAKGQTSTTRWRQTRWAVVRVPTAAWARHAGRPADDLTDEFFASSLSDWEALRPAWEALASRLATASRVRIVGPGTDLSLDVRGRAWRVFAGENNLPDGEIATAPHERGVEGHITFPETFWFGGVELSGLRLDFAAGEVVGVEATRGAAFARHLVATDAGSRRIGELGIGLNPHLRTLTGDLFFDEKVLGTVHVALGRAYPECGGTNASAIHWDIVKDLRGQGALLVDDRPLIDAGSVDRLLLPEAERD